MSVILDIDLDYFGLFEHPLAELERLLTSSFTLTSIMTCCLRGHQPTWGTSSISPCDTGPIAESSE
jgi:hypothetical protein